MDAARLNTKNPAVKRLLQVRWRTAAAAAAAAAAAVVLLALPHEGHRCTVYLARRPERRAARALPGV
jgi:hypothetical protein